MSQVWGICMLMTQRKHRFHGITVMMNSFLLVSLCVCVLCVQACDSECDSKFGNNWGHPGKDQIDTRTITSKEHPVNCILGSFDCFCTPAWKIHFPDTLYLASCPFLLRKTNSSNKSSVQQRLLFLCPSPVVCLQGRNVPIQISLKEEECFLDSHSAERGWEHCVPPGGLVVGSYVRLVSAWQQSEAPLTVSYC